MSKEVGRPFTKGKDPRRNTTKGNKGSKWRKNLLRDLLAAPLGDIEDEQLSELIEKFPNLFKNGELNMQLIMEAKQVLLMMHPDPKVAQAAIKEIKDRIDGKPIVTNVNIETDEIKTLEDERLEEEILELTNDIKSARSGTEDKAS